MAVCYVETFFLWNLCVDAGLLWLVAAWRGGRMHPLRILLGALLGALYAVLAAAAGGMLRSLPAQIIASLGMAAVALPKTTLRKLAQSMGVLWLGAAIMGGIQAMGLSMLPAGLATGFSGMALLRRKNTPLPPSILLTIRVAEMESTMEAIVDTGNRALDPVTGFPVVLIPAGIFDTEACRMLVIRTAAGRCLLPCFVPDALLLDGQPRQAVIACCREGSLECALVPWALCAERKAA